MPEPTQDFDLSFYVLATLAIWILADDALATPEGRQRVKDALRDGVLAGGTYEAILEIPEYRAALRDWELAKQGIFTVDPTAPVPTEPVPAERKA